LLLFMAHNYPGETNKRTESLNHKAELQILAIIII
jgi:hypothetical protein